MNNRKSEQEPLENTDCKVEAFHAASVGKGVTRRLNICGVGPSGVGKSTFCKKLFEQYCTIDQLTEIERNYLNSPITETLNISEVFQFKFPQCKEQDIQVHWYDMSGYGTGRSITHDMEIIKQDLQERIIKWDIVSRTLKTQAVGQQ
jgi:septin family protein